MNASEEGKAKVTGPSPARFGDPRKKTPQNYCNKLLGFACRLLILTLGLGAALSIAAIFDIDA